MQFSLVACLCLLAVTSCVTGQTDKPCPKNVALYKPASQSSAYSSYGKTHLTVDGLISPKNLVTCILTNRESNPWWRVDLLDDYEVSAVQVTAYISYPQRLKNFYVSVGDSPMLMPMYTSSNKTLCVHSVQAAPLGGTTEYKCQQPLVGRFVTLLMMATDYLQLCEIAVIGTPSSDSAIERESLVNVALNKDVASVSQMNGYGLPHTLVDGNLNNKLARQQCHFSNRAPNAWVRIALMDEYKVYYVVVSNRGDSTSTLKNFDIYVGDSGVYNPGMHYNEQLCVSYSGTIATGAIFTSNCREPINGKYVTLMFRDSNNFLAICEIEVYGKPVSGSWPKKPCLKNVAKYKPATQSSDYHVAYSMPWQAVDGQRVNTNYLTCTMTKLEDYPWFRVDLLDTYTVYTVILTQRADCCNDELKNYRISVSDKPSIYYGYMTPSEDKCAERATSVPQGATIPIDCDKPMTGRYVTLAVMYKSYLRVCEVEVMGVPSSDSAKLRESFVNAALNKPASQSLEQNFASYGTAKNAVDSNTLATSATMCTRTISGENMWWRVDLLESVRVYSVVVSTNNPGPKNFNIYVSNTAPTHPYLSPREDVCIHYPGQLPMLATITMDCQEPISGEYVTFALLENNYLWLCEVQVMGIPTPRDPCSPNPCQNNGKCTAEEDGKFNCTCSGAYKGSLCDEGGSAPTTAPCERNVALYKPASQSSAYSIYKMTQKTVDGVTEPSDLKQCILTNTEQNPWWRVDLLDDYKVNSVIITNYNTYADRMKNLYVHVDEAPNLYANHFMDDETLCAHRLLPVPLGGTTNMVCKEPIVGRYVTIVMMQKNYFHVCEVAVMGTPASDSAKLRESLINAALNKPASQSSNHATYGRPLRVVDGNINGKRLTQCTHSGSEKNVWFRVDLVQHYKVYSVIISNTEGAQYTYVKNFDVYVSERGVFHPYSNTINQTPGYSFGMYQYNFYKDLCVHHVGTIQQGATVELACQEPKVGKYVTLMKRDAGYLVLCELQVMAKPVYDDLPEKLCLRNVAKFKPSFQSSEYSAAHGFPMKMVDGDRYNLNHAYCTATKVEDYPWWKVDLLDDYKVYTVILTQRDDCCNDQLKNFRILVSKESQYMAHYYDKETLCAFREPVTVPQGATVPIPCDKPLVGRYVTVSLMYKAFLTLCEVEVMALPASDHARVRETFTNVALYKPAMQSSSLAAASWGTAMKAVDGNRWMKKAPECTRTNIEDHAWFRIDLIDDAKVYAVILTNYGSGASTLKNFNIFVSKEVGFTPFMHRHEDLCLSYNITMDILASTMLDCYEPKVGKYVSMVLSQKGYLHFCELEVLTTSEKIDPCDPNPCENGGQCLNKETGGYECKCAEGFIGTNCDEVPDPCDEEPCENGGKCSSYDEGKYECDCVNGYSGNTCNISPDPCDPNPCLNDGQCRKASDEFRCDCPKGYSGDICDVLPDPCGSEPCQNGGTCTSKQIGQTVNYKCSCTEYYFGEHCETFDLDWIEEKCSSDDDCVADNSVCFKKKCLCKPGLYYSKSTRVCLRKCEDLLKTYTSYEAAMIKQNKLKAIDDISASQCRAECSKDEKCLSLSFMAGKKKDTCFLHAKTANEVGGMWRDSKKEFTYFQRNCA